MTDFTVEFELLKRKELEAEFELEPKKELEATFELKVTKDGKDATINGVNALILDANNGVTLEQNGDRATISGAPLQSALALEEQARVAEDNSLQEQITAIAQKENGYIHEQGIASAVWTVQHNLDKYPSVTVVDSAENEIVAEVEYLDKNTVQITMTGASKGRAYLN